MGRTLLELRENRRRNADAHKREIPPTKEADLEEWERLPPDFWEKAVVELPRPPKSVHLKLDPDVFDYFKGEGKGHLTRMQEVLKSYVLHRLKLQREAERKKK